MARPRLALHWKILIGLALGVAGGVVINRFWTGATWADLGVRDPGAFMSGSLVTRQTAEAAGAANADASAWAHAARFLAAANAFAGDLFLRLLRFISVPIVLFSLVSAAASLTDVRKLGRIGGTTLALFLGTTAVSIAIGVGLARYVVRPGEGFSPEDVQRMMAGGAAQAADAMQNAQKVGTLWGMLLDIVPANPFRALAEGQMLQVVFAAIAVGLGLTLVPEEKRSLVTKFCDGVTDAIVHITHAVLAIAPFAVFALVVKVVANLGPEVLVNLAKYAGTVVGALLIVMLVVYPSLLIGLRSRVGPVGFFKATSPAMLLAFSSSSSGATLPVTIECCEKRLGIRGDIVSFVIPLGATVNMNGTALYQGVAACFIAQLYGLDLSLGQQLTVILTATAAAVGTAAVPSAGIVTLVPVLQSAGVPAEGIAMILGVDRVLDMCRTTVNVTGDMLTATIVGTSEGAINPPAGTDAE